MYGFGWYKSPPTSWDEERGQGEAYFTFVYGANVAEVEVDTETGKVDVVNFISCHDVGKAINRNTVLGQFYGGVAMGLGYGLLEEFDFEESLPKQLNFDEYLIPTSMDVPPITGIIVENEDAAGPFGAKSIGEPANEIAAPAIINAIYNATGSGFTSFQLRWSACCLDTSSCEKASAALRRKKKTKCWLILVKYAWTLSASLRPWRLKGYNRKGR